MAELKIPQDFWNWLNDTYNYEQANTWYLNHLWGTGWQTDPVYQYWEQWVRPQTQALSQERMAKAQAFAQKRMGPTPPQKRMEEEVPVAGDELVNLIQQVLDNSGMTEGQAESLFDRYIDTNDPIGLIKTDTLFRRYAEQAGVNLPLTKREQAAQLKQSEREQAAQLERTNEVKQALDYTRRNPLVTGKDLSATFAPGQGAIYGTADDWMNNAATADLMQDYITGKSDDFVNKLAKLNERVTTRGIGEEQVNLNLLASLERGKEQKEPWLRPLIPSAGRVAEQFLAGTKLGEGTKLRSFIESEIPSLYEEVRAKREDWHRKMNPEPIEVETYEDVRDRLQAGADKWQAIAATAPTSEFTAQTVWGPGGLAGIAQQAYEHAQKSISALKPGDFPTRTGLVPIKPEEDPFAKALRERDFKARYYRQPRTGIVSRLQPSIRFR